VRRLALLAVLLACASAQAQTPGLFAYDASRPLDVREQGARETGGAARIVELAYASPKGGRVPATLVLPEGEGPFGAVVFQHGGPPSRRGDFLAEAESLAGAGVASLLVDAPFNRPGARPFVTFDVRDRNAYAQNVIDLRRGIDLLAARPEIDAKRIALVGFSYGGVLAGVVAGVDRRLAAVAVMSGPGRITEPLRDEGRRQGIPARRLARYLAAMRAVDAVPYVGRATARFLFQFGRRDAMPAAWFRAYVAAAPRGSRVRWYAAGHGLSEAAARDRRAWLLDRLSPGRKLAGAADDAGRFVAELARSHPDPWHAVPRARLAAEAARLDRRLGELSREEAVVELMRLAARPGVRDGHTGVFPLDPGHARPLTLLPVRLYSFPEGWFVVDELGPLGLVGSRLVKIGGVPVERVARAVQPLVPADNESSRLARTAQWLVVAEVLRGLGFRPAELTFARPGGARRTVRLRAVPAARWGAAFPDLFHPMVPQGLPQRPRPAYLARRGEERWTALLDRGRAAYVAVNVMLGSPFEAARELERLAARPSVQRVVVDLRHNPGGDNTTYGSLLEAVRQLGRRERIVVLTSRTTFSAAANFLADLERTTPLTLVGEPTGGSPNLYGDPATVPLPASGLQANVATRWWEKAPRDDRRLAFEPDRRVALTARAFFAGRDPVLAAALRLSA
jgi:dienelactone hydrolase